jgi:hypothetical protein
MAPAVPLVPGPTLHVYTGCMRHRPITLRSEAWQDLRQSPVITLVEQDVRETVVSRSLIGPFATS